MIRSAPVLLLAAVVVSHLPLLFAGYVQDDHVAIEASPIAAGAQASVILGSSYWEGIRGADRSLYRPLTVSSYAIERALFGHPMPAMSHAANLVLHALACWLLYSIALRCGLSVQPALLGALLFAVCPAKSEAVANVVGRAEILAAIFTLAAVRLALERGSRAAAWGAGCCVLLACASKETGLAALPLVALASFATLSRNRRQDWIDLTGMVLPSVLAFVVFVILRTEALEAFFPAQTVPVMDNPLAAEHGVRAIATALALVTRYAAIVLFPWGLANDYSGASVPIETTVLAWRPLVGLALAVGAVGLVSRSRRLALFVAIAGLPYLLVSNLFVPVGAILAERFLYLPIAGICLVAAATIQRFEPASRRIAILAIAVLFGLMLSRSLDWDSDRRIFAATARNNPLSPRAPYWLGTLAVEDGHPEEAGPYFDASIRNWPAFASPWQEKGLLLARSGDAGGAERNLSEAIRLEPTWASPRLNLALVLHRRRDLEGALKSARTAALLDPGYAKAWAEIGHLQFESGRFPAAVDAYRRAIALGRTDLSPRLSEAESFNSRSGARP